MSVGDITEPLPKSVTVDFKSWNTSKILLFCLLTGLAAGLDAVAGSPVMGSEWRDFILIASNLVIAALRKWFTSQPIG